jgi:hypothetical protein
MDKIDAAVAKLNEPAPEMRVDLQVSINGRVAHMNLPMPLTAEETIQLIVSLPGFIAQANSQYLAARGGGIALPDGRLIPVPSPDPIEGVQQ